MGITAEQLQMAGLIDARVKAITRSGVDDFAIFTEMADYMPAFKRLMDTSTDDDMDQLAARYTGLFDSRTSARPLQSPFPRQPEHGLSSALHGCPRCFIRHLLRLIRKINDSESFGAEAFDVSFFVFQPQ
jgi:hypothetical protein